MMKFILFILFLMPLFKLNFFWLIQYLFMFLSFLFLLNFNVIDFWSCLSYNLGMDLLSYSMVMLSMWICSLMILASGSLYKNKFYSDLFLLCMIFLLISLLLAFFSLNLFSFYLFFEVSLLPTLMLIIGWGYQPERLEAGFYLLIYTMLGSLPMLISIFYYYENYGSLSFLVLENSDSLLLYLGMIIVFLIKMPMFFVHLWLPKAHVEAPVSGSMILAGVMLKLGGYGLMRVMYMFLSFKFLNMLIVSISLIGGMIVSLICLRQSDMKSLIAYSSVAHMGMALAGLMTISSLSYWGALVMMLAHGLCSSGLFCISNIIYERTNSRSLYLNKGMINIMPSLSLWVFLFCSSNMAAPPSLNLLGEICLINSLVSFNYMNSIFLFMLTFLSAVYSLYLYFFSQHGKFSSNLFSFSIVSIREYMVLMLHWVPLNILILKSDYLIYMI